MMWLLGLALASGPSDQTLVYYTGGEQHFAGDLQWATFDGTPQELLEAYFAEP